MISVHVRGALGALALALLSAPAFAQAPVAAPVAGRPHHDMAEMRQMMEQHRAAMAQDLRTVLKLRPDQEAAFTAFQASMTPPPHEERMKHDHAAMAAMTTPQKLDMMQTRMDEHMARMHKHIEAVKTFYAALSPEQQHVFDALERLHHGGMGGHGMGGHGWGGRGMMRGPGEGPPPPPAGE